MVLIIIQGKYSRMSAWKNFIFHSINCWLFWHWSWTNNCPPYLWCLCVYMAVISSVSPICYIYKCSASSQKGKRRRRKEVAAAAAAVVVFVVCSQPTEMPTNRRKKSVQYIERKGREKNVWLNIFRSPFMCTYTKALCTAGNVCTLKCAFFARTNCFVAGNRQHGVRVYIRDDAAMRCTNAFEENESKLCKTRANDKWRERERRRK